MSHGGLNVFFMDGATRSLATQICNLRIAPVAGYNGGGLYRGVEQLVARRNHSPEVGGSIPPPAIWFFDRLVAGLAQLAEQ